MHKKRFLVFGIKKSDFMKSQKNPTDMINRYESEKRFTLSFLEAQKRLICKSIEKKKK